MKRILKSWKHPYLARVGIFLIALALIVGTVSCNGGGGSTKYSLTMAVNPVAGGTATDLTNASPYAAGTGVSIKAVAAVGYKFVSWTAPAGGFANATAATTNFTMPAQNVIVTANFQVEQVEVGPLDHFKWYFADSVAPINEVVYLEDQFGTVNATVGYAAGFGNPVMKWHGQNVTSISNPDHHLTAYYIDYEGAPQTYQVEVKNQFGTQNLTVSGPIALLVPTQKEGHQAPVSLDHYLLYGVTEGASVGVNVSLQDQFDTQPQESTVYDPMYFANPVRKTHGNNVTEILHPETHLVFYSINAAFSGNVTVVNQFGAQTLNVYTYFGFGGLAVPSEKIHWEKLAELPEQPTELVIGTARDTDEAYATFEQTVAGPAMREFVEQVNLAGGVHLKAYDTATEECWVPLVIDMREVNVAAWDVANVTQGICDDIAAGDVHFLWGGPGNDFILAQAPIANDAQVVLLTFEGGAAYMRNNPDKLASWPYVFMPLSYSDWYQLPVLADMLEAKLGRTPKAYVVHIAGEHGDDYLDVAEDYFDVVDDVEVPLDAAAMNASAVIDDAIAALGDPADPNYDIFCGFIYPQHLYLITGSAMALGFNPPAMVFGPGAGFGYYPYWYGDPSLVDGILSFTVAAYNTNAEIQAVYDLIAERMDDDAGDPLSGIPGFPGILSLDYWGTPCYWAGMEMWLAAVEEVGYVDQELIKDALAAFEDYPVPTVLAEETWFRMYGVGGGGGGNLDYLCHTGEIGQWQSGVYETVGPVDAGQAVPGLPNYIVTGNFSFPMTDAWGWLS